MNTKRILLLTALALTVPLAGAHALDVSWTNTAGGNWNTAANWSPNQVPGPNDAVWITNNGTYTITLNAHVNLAGFALGGTSGTQTLNHATYTLALNGPGNSSANGVYTLASGTLTGSGLLNLAGRFNWTGGTLGGAGSNLVLTAGGGLAIGGATAKTLYSTLINNGTGTWSGGLVTCFPSALFSNTPNGAFDLSADGSAFSVQSGSPSFINAGTLRKSAGTGTTTVSVPCGNSGSVQVNHGTLSLTLDDSAGSFTALAGATLSVKGTALLSPSSSITGAGNFTVTAGAITNEGELNISGTNTFSGGTAVFAGSCTLTNNPMVLSGASTVIFDGTGTVSPWSLTLSGGSLLGSLPVSVSGPFTWSGGTIGAAGSSLVVFANGGLTLNGSAKYLYATLVNNGAGTWSAGAVSFYSTALFSNTPAGTLYLTADGTALSKNSGTPAFANAGILRKTTGTATTTISVPCGNTGSVQVDSGTLALTLADSTGSFANLAGATLNVNGAAVLSPGSSIAGAGNYIQGSGALTNHGTFDVTGTNTFSGGTAVFAGSCPMAGSIVVVSGGMLVLNAAGAMTPASLTLSSGFLQGNMPVTISGLFLWTGGTNGSAGSSLAVTVNGGLTISSSATKALYATLVNNAAGTWSGTWVSCYGAALVSNAPAATLDLTADGDAFYSVTTGPALANAGTLRKTAGTGMTTVSVPCANTGTIQVNSGTLALTLTNGSGSFTAASGATLRVSGTATLSPGSSTTGAGNYVMTSGAITNSGTFNLGGTNTFFGGTAVFSGSCPMANTALVVSGAKLILHATDLVTPASLTLSLAGGTLQGSVPVTVSGVFKWNGGTLGNEGSPLVVTANGGLTISGSAYKGLDCTLVNNGPASWNGAEIDFTTTAVMSNAPAATFDLMDDGYFIFSGAGAFINTGTIRKSAGGGTTTIFAPFRNAGSVQANSGTLRFASSFLQTGGEALLNSGTFSFISTAQFQGGEIIGSGTVTGSVSNNAIVRPGASPGLLSITGDYVEGANAHLQIELGGTTPGTSHDQLSVGGTAALAGTLDVSYWNGFTPSPGNIFTVLVSSARSGVFSTIQAPTNDLTASYNANSVLVQITNAFPMTPQLNIQLTAPDAVLVSWPSPSTGWNLQQNTSSVSSANWSNVTSGITDNSTTKTLIVNPPAGNRFYRLHKP